MVPKHGAQVGRRSGPEADRGVGVSYVQAALQIKGLDEMTWEMRTSTESKGPRTEPWGPPMFSIGKGSRGPKKKKKRGREREEVASKLGGTAGECALLEARGKCFLREGGVTCPWV